MRQLLAYLLSVSLSIFQYNHQYDTTLIDHHKTRNNVPPLCHSILLRLSSSLPNSPPMKYYIDTCPMEIVFPCPTPTHAPCTSMHHAMRHSYSSSIDTCRPTTIRYHKSNINQHGCWIDDISQLRLLYQPQISPSLPPPTRLLLCKWPLACLQSGTTGRRSPIKNQP